MFDCITAIGDVSSSSCWSGIPYHFWRASQRAGWSALPIKLPMADVRYRRIAWNMKQFLLARGSGGFQYSNDFGEWAWSYFPKQVNGSNFLSFHPFVPPVSKLCRGRDSLSLYFDATHPLMFSRYGLGRDVSKWMKRYLLDKERRVFDQAERLVFFQRWAAESAVKDCGADPAKVHVILPGANLEPSSSFVFQDSITRKKVNGPFYFGYVGKDWKRKGFVKLLAVVEELNSMGVRVILRCIGLIPGGAESNPYVEYYGFLNKETQHDKIIEIMASCDLGCLLSEVDASSISMLEFLRVGVPVMSTNVDGMGDLIPPDAGFCIASDLAINSIAEILSFALKDETKMTTMRHAARRWSSFVTWDRCITEWAELINSGTISNPVRPWLGLPKINAKN